jgi:hypothetical protein
LLDSCGKGKIKAREKGKRKRQEIKAREKGKRKRQEMKERDNEK